MVAINKAFKIDKIINNERRLFKAYGSVEMYDRDGELIPMEEFHRFMDIWMARGAPIMDSHSNRQIGKGLNYNFETTEDGKEAVKITGEIYKDYPLDDKVWKEIKSGDRKGLSLGADFYAPVEQTEKGSILRGLVGYEFSVVKETGNQGALFQEISLAKGKENMAEVKKEDVLIEEKPEAELDVKQLIGELLEKFNKIEERLNIVEDAMSGKPDGMEKEDGEQMPEEDGEETKKGDEEPASEEKEEEVSVEEESSVQDAPAKETPASEESQDSGEVEKRLKTLEKENAELKKSLEARTIVKAKRPAVEDIEAASKNVAEATNEIMKQFSANKVSWEDAVSQIKKLHKR